MIPVVRYAIHVAHHELKTVTIMAKILEQALPGLTRKQIFTYASSVDCCVAYFVDAWHLHISAKHACKKVNLKPLHHLENYIFFLKTLR